MNQFSLIFHSYCYLILINAISAENLTKPLIRSSDSITFDNDYVTDGNNSDEEYDDTTHYMDDSEDVEEDHMQMSETVNAPTNNLDNSVSHFLDSGINVLLETNNVFKQELNHSKTDSEAKDIWIAYSNSWHRVIEALINDIMPKIVNSNTDIDISMDCLSAMIAITSGLKKQKDWAVKLFDSSGRPFEAGSLDGTITSLGDYDQCLSIETDSRTDPMFVGQYCILKYRIALPPKPEHLTLQSKVFNFTGTPVHGTFLEEFSRSAHAFYDRFGRIGICIPSLCNKYDFQKIIKQFIAESHLKLSINDCHTKELPKFTGLQIAILTIFSIILFLMIFSTSLDLIIVYTESSNPLPFIHFESQIRKLILSTILSFSVYSNGKILFTTTTHSTHKSIDAINGIRVLSMAWILWTHTYLIPIKETFSFARDFMFTVEELGFQLILNGWVLVDSFFLVGAMLTTYSHLTTLQKSDGRINILQLILNRIFRFWPSIWLTVMLVFLIPSLASGPLWKEYFDVQTQKCYSNWWTTIFFINNWFDESKMCLLHTWYLSADMQLFIIAFIFIILLYKKPSLGLYIISATAMASCLAIGIRTYLLRQPPTVLYNTPSEREVYNQASTIYVHTYIHLGPYLVGIILGYILFKKWSYKLNPILNLMIWLIALFSCLTIMLSTYTLNRGEKWSPFSSALYAGLHRTAWSLSIGWIIFACVSGNGGPINAFLSWKFFAPLGKLSFMIYLMHFLVIWVRYAYIRAPLPFSHYVMFCEFVTNLVISICLSIVTHLAVEAPMIALYRLYLSNLFTFSNLNINRFTGKSFDETGFVVTSKL